MPEQQAASSSAPDVSIPTYPAQYKSTGGKVGGISTEVVTTCFSDRIVMTISQEGKIGQWFSVALEPRNASIYAGMAQPDLQDDGDDLLPLPHLSTQTLLGASNEERETTGQLYAAQIASSIMAKRPDENRILLLGLGLTSATQVSSEGFFDLLGLATQTI